MSKVAHARARKYYYIPNLDLKVGRRVPRWPVYERYIKELLVTGRCTYVSYKDTFESSSIFGGYLFLSLDITRLLDYSEVASESLNPSLKL